MSLLFSDDEVKRITNGAPVDDELLLDVLHRSLPKAMEIVKAATAHGTAETPADTTTEGQILRAMASTPIRCEIERIYGGVRFVLTPKLRLFALRNGSARDAEPAIRDVIGSYARNADGTGITFDQIRMELQDGMTILRGITLESQHLADGEIATHAPEKMEDAPRLQLLRLMAVDHYRRLTEQNLGRAFAFLNCHATSGGKPTPKVREALTKWASLSNQVLNQSPVRRDC